MAPFKTFKSRAAATALAVSVSLTGIAGSAFGTDGNACPARELAGEHTAQQAQQASASGPKSIVIRENLTKPENRWELNGELGAYRIKGYLAYAVQATPSTLPEGYVDAYCR